MRQIEIGNNLATVNSEEWIHFDPRPPKYITKQKSSRLPFNQVSFEPLCDPGTGSESNIKRHAFLQSGTVCSTSISMNLPWTQSPKQTLCRMLPFLHRSRPSFDPFDLPSNLNDDLLGSKTDLGVRNKAVLEDVNRTGNQQKRESSGKAGQPWRLILS
jgi:hypothetical protein